MYLRKRGIAVLLSIVMFFSFVIVFTSASEFAENVENLRSSVITAELGNIMAVATVGEKIPVQIWMQEVDIEAVETAALKETGLNRDKIREMVMNGEDEQLTMDDINSYIAAERRIYAEMQSVQNEDFLASFPSVISANEVEEAFISRYSPMIVMELTSSEIKTLSLSQKVESICYAPEIEMVSEMAESLPTVRADYVRDTLGYTGAGVKIGQVESAFPDVTGQAFWSNRSKIHLWPDGVQSKDSDEIAHATMVANIMVGQGNSTTGLRYMGIAPDAELYCATFSSSSSFYKAVEWLIESQVNVINMSAGVGATGSYENLDKWVDHIAFNHSVHFVKSAGNRNAKKYSYDKLITSPGMAYNVITVGAISDNNTTTYNDDILASYSSYIESSGYANKPDLVAPGSDITTFIATTNGTSFAAPHVTGIIAQLIQQRPALSALQDTMKAILTAAINHDKLRFTSSSSEFDKYGAGVVDSRSAIYSSKNYFFANGNFAAGTAANTYRDYTFTISSSDDLKRISLTWLKYTKFNSDSGNSHIGTTPDVAAAIANLDMQILNASGKVIAETSLKNGNLEIIQLDNPTPGTYTIRVYCRSAVGQRVYYSVAWW